MCLGSPKAPTPTVQDPDYVHNPYLDGGAYGNQLDANRIGTDALTIGLGGKQSGTPTSLGIGGPSSSSTIASQQGSNATSNVR